MASAHATADAGVNPLLNPPAVGEETAPPEDGDTSRMPSALEATEGIASEITTHDEKALSDSSELSPEEQAISGMQSEQVPEQIPDENEDNAALAEGRTEPPAP